VSRYIVSKQERRTRQRGVLARLIFVKQQLLTRSPITSVKIAREWECEVKTIHRDIAFLRDRLGHQLEWDCCAGTWRYLTPPQPVL
jgi:hypothetical protein